MSEMYKELPHFLLGQCPASIQSYVEESLGGTRISVNGENFQQLKQKHETSHFLGHGIPGNGSSGFLLEIFNEELLRSAKAKEEKSKNPNFTIDYYALP